MYILMLASQAYMYSERFHSSVEISSLFVIYVVKITFLHIYRSDQHRVTFSDICLTYGRSDLCSYYLF